MKINITRDKKAMIDFRKWSLFFICVYAVMMYATYINSVFSIIASLCLRGMLGFSILYIIINRNVKTNSYIIWYSLFIVFCGASILFVSNVSSAISVFKTLVVVLGIGVSVTIAVKEKKEIEMVLYCMSIGSVFLMLYLIFSGYVAEYDALNDPTKRFGNELTGNANIFAAIYMIAACASAYIILTNKKKKVKIAFALAFVLQMYGLVLAGSRKNLLIPFFMLYILFIQKKDKKGRSHWIITTIIGVFVMLLGYYLLMNVPFLYDNIGYRFETVIEYETGNAASADTSAMVREAMREKAMVLWTDHPIFGYGLNMFTDVSGFGMYTHNNFLELMCNHGIVGMILYYSFYGYLLYKLFKNKSQHKMFKYFSIAMVISELIYEYGAITYNGVPNHLMLMLISIFAGKTDNEEIQNGGLEC